MSNFFCHEQCQYESLLYKGNKYTEVGARYCDKCECYYQKEYGVWCKCCHKKLRTRLRYTYRSLIRGRERRGWEQFRALFEEKENIQKHQLQERPTIRIQS